MSFHDIDSSTSQKDIQAVLTGFNSSEPWTLDTWKRVIQWFQWCTNENKEKDRDISQILDLDSYTQLFRSLLIQSFHYPITVIQTTMPTSDATSTANANVKRDPVLSFVDSEEGMQSFRLLLHSSSPTYSQTAMKLLLDSLSHPIPLSLDLPVSLEQQPFLISRLLYVCITLLVSHPMYHQTQRFSFWLLPLVKELCVPKYGMYLWFLFQMIQCSDDGYLLKLADGMPHVKVESNLFYLILYQCFRRVFVYETVPSAIQQVAHCCWLHIYNRRNDFPTLYQKSKKITNAYCQSIETLKQKYKSKSSISHIQLSLPAIAIEEQKEKEEEEEEEEEEYKVEMIRFPKEGKKVTQISFSQ